MANRIWRERDHPRANDGKFARKGGSNWLARVSKQFEASFGDTSAGERTFQGERTDPRLGGRLQTGSGSLLDIAGMSKAAKAKYPKRTETPGTSSRAGMAQTVRDAAAAYRPRVAPGPNSAVENRYKQKLADKLDNLAGRIETGDTSAEEARTELARMGRDAATFPSNRLSTGPLVSAQKSLRARQEADFGLDRPAPAAAGLTEAERNRRLAAAGRLPVESTDSFLARMSAKAAPSTGLDTGRATELNGGMATTVSTRTATQRVPLKNLDRRTDQELRDMLDRYGASSSDAAQADAAQIRGELDRRAAAAPLPNDRPFRGGTIVDETPEALRPLRDQVWQANTKKDAATVLRNADPELVGQLADHLGVARTRAAVVDAVRNGVTAEAKAQKPQDLTPAMQSTLDRIRKNGGLSFRLNSNSRRFATVSPQERVVLQALERRGLVRNTGSGIDFKYELVDQVTPPAADVAAHIRPKPSTGVVLPGKKVTIKGTPEGIQIRDAGTTDYKGDKMYTLFDADGNEIGTLQKVTRTSAVKAPDSRIASGFRKSTEWEATVKGGTTSREKGTGYTAAQALERMPSKAEVDAARQRRREQNARSAGAEISANDMSGALGKLTQQAIQRDIAQKEYSDLLGHPDPTVQARAQKLLDNWLRGLMTPDEFQREMQVERDRAEGKA